MPVNFSSLTTKPGIYRVVFAITGLLGVVIGTIATNKSDWVEVRATCPVWTCPPPWLAQLGVSFVIISWLFGVFILFGSVFPKLSDRKVFRQMDIMGHTMSGFALTTAFTLFISFVVLALLFAPCDVEFSGTALQKTVQKIECKILAKNKAHIFQPVLFSIGGVLALGNGVLALLITKMSRQSAYSSTTGVIVSAEMQSSSQNRVSPA